MPDAGALGGGERVEQGVEGGGCGVGPVEVDWGAEVVEEVGFGVEGSAG